MTRNVIVAYQTYVTYVTYHTYWHHTLPMFCSIHQPYCPLSTKTFYAPHSCKPSLFYGHIWTERHIWFLPLFCRGLKNRLCKNHIDFLVKYMEITHSFQINIPFIEIYFRFISKQAHIFLLSWFYNLDHINVSNRCIFIKHIGHKVGFPLALCLPKDYVERIMQNR